MDRIEIERMTFYANIGTTKPERELGHVVHVDLVLHADLTQAGRTDDLKATVDYGDVVRAARQVAETGEYNLIEALAEKLAGRVLADFPVDRVEVRVEKPYPSVNGRVERVAVRIDRGQEG